MDAAAAFLTEAFGPLGPVYAFAAVAVTLIALAAPLLLRRPEDPFDRLERDNTELSGLRGVLQRGAAAAGPGRLRHEGGDRLQSLAPFLEPQDDAELDDMRLKLLQAGYRSRSAVRMFYFARGVLSIALTSFAVAYLTLRSSDTSFTTYLLGAGLALIIGFMAPSYWVTRRRAAREIEIANGFPDALDLMLICVEAGQSLDQALIKVATEIQHAHPALAEEFAIISQEMRAGRDRPTVLRDFARRAGVQDISSFVTVLVQSASFGTSVAEALRIYAAEMRDKRIMRAEEKANTLPTKLTLGTMFFTVPPLLLILIGPSLIDILNAVQGMAR